MDSALVYTLDMVRAHVGHPLVIDSGYRTPSHNASLGSKPNSAHLKGMAVDISAPSGSERYELVQTALEYGFKRIGLGDDYVHLDIDMTLPHPTIFREARG